MKDDSMPEPVPSFDAKDPAWEVLTEDWSSLRQITTLPDRLRHIAHDESYYLPKSYVDALLQAADALEIKGKS